MGKQKGETAKRVKGETGEQKGENGEKGKRRKGISYEWLSSRPFLPIYPFTHFLEGPNVIAPVAFPAFKFVGYPQATDMPALHNLCTFGTTDLADEAPWCRQRL